MLFLRITLLFIFVSGFLVYFISTRIRSEFFKTGGEAQSIFRGHSAEFKAYCKNPPTEYISKLLKLKKKLSVALIISSVSFLLAILSVAL
jgi:hypothetical protein